MTTQRKRRTTIRSQASVPITQSTTSSISGLPDVERGHVPLGDLIPNPANPRVIDDQEAAGLCKSIERFGLVQEVVVNRRSGQIVGGHQRVQALRAKDLPNHTLVPVAWVDLDERDEEALNVALNNPAIQGHYTGDVRAILERLKTERPVVVDELRLDAVLADVIRVSAHERWPAEERDDEIPDVVKGDVHSKRGEVYNLGRHRLMCGDCTDEQNVDTLLDGARVDLVITDPPYCSGGFQEAGKHIGSIGLRKNVKNKRAFDRKIANDRLSTRGYQALIRNMLGRFSPAFAYMFTDWRMWLALFESLESTGIGVRSMIVWDKGTPGMGLGWRSQHEIIAFAAAAAPPFDPYKSLGNVIRCTRQRSELHPTQKPLEIMTMLLGVVDFARIIADPFAGSGTTLLAGETQGCTCYAMELDPFFCDIIRRRWTKWSRDNGKDPGSGKLEPVEGTAP